MTDYGGRVEELVLKSQSKEEGEPQQVLLSHNGDAEAIKENVWWKGMFLVPWANRIANVSFFYNDKDDIFFLGSNSYLLSIIAREKLKLLMLGILGGRKLLLDLHLLQNHFIKDSMHEHGNDQYNQLLYSHIIFNTVTII